MEPSLSLCLPTNRENEVREEKICSFHKCHLDRVGGEIVKLGNNWIKKKRENSYSYKMAHIRCDTERLRIQDMREETWVKMHSYCLCECVCLYIQLFISWEKIGGSL